MRRFFLLASLLLAASGARATVSFDVAVDRLDDNNGALVPAGALVLLVADTDGDGLGQAISGDVSLRAFLDGSSGDDLIVYRSDLSSLGITGSYGASTGGLDLEGAGSGQWSEGDPLYLVWFPNLSISTVSLPAGEAYGARGLGQTPADGGNDALVYVAPTNTGAFGNTRIPLSSTNLRADLLSSQLIAPPSVISPSVTSVTETSATLGGEVSADNGNAVSDRGVVYSVVSVNSEPVIGGSGVSATSASGTLGVFAVPVPGLAGGQTYAFRAFATNASGTGYSASSFFTTDSQLDLSGGIASVSRNMLPGDRHRFRFTLTGIQVVNLSTVGGLLRARLYDPTGQLIAEQGVEGNVDFSDVLLDAGTYLLELFRDPGEGAAESYTLAVNAAAASFARPDGAVGSSLTSVTGNHVYLPALQQLTLASPDSRTVTGYVTATNRGNINDRFTVQGTPGNVYFTVVYFDESGANITAQVVAGTFLTPQTAPEAAPRWVRAAVTPSRRAVQLRRSHTLGINLDSLFDANASDGVSILVKTR